jgi:hypothetical protein
LIEMRLFIILSSLQGARGKTQKTLKGYTKLVPKTKDEKLIVQMQKRFRDNGLILTDETF